MTNSATGRPVFQQNALRRAGGHLYRPAGQLANEIGPVIQNLDSMALAGGSKNHMAGRPAAAGSKIRARYVIFGGKFSHILHCIDPDLCYNIITERERDPKPLPRDARRG